MNLQAEVKPGVHTSGRYGFAVMANIKREQRESLKRSRRKVSVKIKCRFTQAQVNDPSKILPKCRRLHLQIFKDLRSKFSDHRLWNNEAKFSLWNSHISWPLYLWTSASCWAQKENIWKYESDYFLDSQSYKAKYIMYVRGKMNRLCRQTTFYK